MYRGTNMNSENRELNVAELDTVAGGMPFYGANCSVRQNEAIGAIVDGLGSVPIVGPVLAGAATVAGWIICGGL
jgi:hypothetical protein